jgi:hypothetical protein
MINLEFASNFLKEGYGNELATIEIINGTLCVNDLLAFPIFTSSFYDKSNSPKIQNEAGVEIGEILFLKDDNEVEIQSLPLNKAICLLQDCPADSITESRYLFNSDYVLIYKPYLDEYLQKYKTNSSVWGWYFHKEALPNIIFNGRRVVRSINAIENIELNRPLYFESLEIAFKETNPFLRFLKMYHLLELRFDIHTAEKIRDYLGQPNKEVEIGRLLRDYNREDILRLESLFTMNIDVIKLISKLDKVIYYRANAERIFYDYTKESNPLKSRSDFQGILGSGGFSEPNVKGILNGRAYEMFIKKLAAYWIYRIRCCIAHNKLGEYLMTIADEEFVAEFAEPLLNEIIIHCYKK